MQRHKVETGPISDHGPSDILRHPGSGSFGVEMVIFALALFHEGAFPLNVLNVVPESVDPFISPLFALCPEHIVSHKQLPLLFVALLLIVVMVVVAVMVWILNRDLELSALFRFLAIQRGDVRDEKEIDTFIPPLLFTLSHSIFAHRDLHVRPHHETSRNHAPFHHTQSVTDSLRTCHSAQCLKSANTLIDSELAMKSNHKIKCECECGRGDF